MVKYMDDFKTVTQMSVIAGVVKADSEWALLEFDICQQVDWNLRLFCSEAETTKALCRQASRCCCCCS
jgi:hypothetical protein